MRLRLDVSTTLNMTENLYESVVNRPIRRFSVCRGDHWSPALCLMVHNGVIPSEVEESRGNERGGWSTTIPSF